MTPQDDEDTLKIEEVERRREVRGIFHGLSVQFGGETFDAVEASRRGAFVQVTDPDAYALGDVREARFRLGDAEARCRLEVVRKEIAPRRGIALRISFIDPTNEEKLKQLLGPVAEQEATR